MTEKMLTRYRSTLLVKPSAIGSLFLEVWLIKQWWPSSVTHISGILWRCELNADRDHFIRQTSWWTWIPCVFGLVPSRQQISTLSHFNLILQSELVICLRCLLAVKYDMINLYGSKLGPTRATETDIAPIVVRLPFDQTSKMQSSSRHFWYDVISTIN